ncbi:MAG: hypothetical protein LBG09_02145 [Puniceicoccales bacterium]|jgi:peptidoglycan hydrolase CwlO-like protein|nr:hypothetical protein [Puniceicoccales bacterium]
MDMSPVLDAAKRAAYAVAKYEKTEGKGHFGIFGGKKIKQETNLLAAERFKEALAGGTSAITRLMDNATDLLAKGKVAISNSGEFKASMKKAIETLESPEGQETMRRVSSVQELQQQVSALKAEMTGLRDTINGNDHLKRMFSGDLAKIEESVNGQEKNLNIAFDRLMNNRGQLTDKAKTNLEQVVSQKNMNAIKNQLKEFSSEFQKLGTECSKRMESIEKLAERVKWNPAGAFEYAMLYTDPNEARLLSEEAYKTDPNLIAENIIASGTALLDRFADTPPKNSPGAFVHPVNQRSCDIKEAQLLRELIEKFAKYVPDEFKTAKGGKEFLKKLETYCEKLANSFDSKMEESDKEIKKVQGQIKAIDDDISSVQKSTENKVRGSLSSIASKFGLKISSKSDALVKLEEQKKAFTQKIKDIEGKTATAISGEMNPKKMRNGQPLPRRNFYYLGNDLTNLRNAIKHMKQ